MIWRTISLLLFGSALIYAPLAYGCTTTGTAFWLDVLLLSGTGAAAIHKLAAREPFRIPGVPLVCVLILALIASAHVVNARFSVNETTAEFVPTGRGGAPWLPSALDLNAALSVSFHFLALGAAFVVLIDRAQHRRERWVLLGATAISGMVIAILGISLDVAQFRKLPFSTDGEQFSFATFLYHGNAAAFLNLCWPAAMALLARAMQGGNHLARALWANGLLFTFGALFVNASKFGHAVGIPALLLAGWLTWRCMEKGRWSPSPLVATTGALVILAAAVILTLPTLTTSIERWEVLARQGEHSRGITARAALGMIRDAPLWGIGPGCFRWGFPFYTAHLGDGIRGVWIHAHQDYIQTFVEWGILGGSVWMILIGGGLWRGWAKLSRGAKGLSTVAAVMGLSITAVHCLLDFPLQIASLQCIAAVHLAILWGGREKHPQRRSARGVGNGEERQNAVAHPRIPGVLEVAERKAQDWRNDPSAAGKAGTWQGLARS